MPEGTLCNRTPINTKEALHALLADKSGKTYYEEMNAPGCGSCGLEGDT